MKIVLCCVGVLCSMCAAATTNVAIDVGAFIAALRGDYGHGGRFPQSILILEDWQGTGILTNGHFRLLQGAASNQWQSVWASLNCLTNSDDRLVVIAAGAANNEADYLARISFLADMVLSNKVSSVELRYFVNRCSDVNHFVASTLVRRYDEPSVSNLIMKVNAAGGFPGGVSDIFSGEDKRWYENAVREGLIP